MKDLHEWRFVVAALALHLVIAWWAPTPRRFALPPNVAANASFLEWIPPSLDEPSDEAEGLPSLPEATARRPRVVRTPGSPATPIPSEVGVVETHDAADENAAPVEAVATGSRVLPSLMPSDWSSLARAQGSPTEDAPRDNLPAGARVAGSSARVAPRRAAPTLVERSDGSFRYDGPQFDAHIRPDGAVVFEDLAAASAHLNGIFPVVVFDLSNLAEQAAGNDPYYAERRWFMEQTAALRDGLARQAHAREFRVVEGRLRLELARVWQSARPAAQRRRTLFSMWDEMADDDVGRTGKQVIVDFVVTNLPSTSADGFPAAELERLNASRVSTEAFEPY